MVQTANILTENRLESTDIAAPPPDWSQFLQK